MNSINLNTVVLTSKQVVNKFCSITYVVHNDDGLWEFYGPDDITELDILVVSLAQIINIDPSVKEVLDMPENFQAMRNEVNSPWNIVSKS